MESANKIKRGTLKRLNGTGEFEIDWSTLGTLKPKQLKLTKLKLKLQGPRFLGSYLGKKTNETWAKNPKSIKLVYIAIKTRKTTLC